MRVTLAATVGLLACAAGQGILDAPPSWSAPPVAPPNGHDVSTGSEASGLYDDYNQYHSAYDSSTEARRQQSGTWDAFDFVMLCYIAILAVVGVILAVVDVILSRTQKRAMVLVPAASHHELLQHVGGAAHLATTAPFSSGVWTGHYTHEDGQHDVPKFQLQFVGGIVQGEGTDDVGGYTIRGVVGTDGHVAFTKHISEDGVAARIAIAAAVSHI